jgi:hypothetical protein
MPKLGILEAPSVKDKTNHLFIRNEILSLDKSDAKSDTESAVAAKSRLAASSSL